MSAVSREPYDPPIPRPARSGVSPWLVAALLVAIAALLLAGGLLHRPAVAGEEADRRAVVVAAHEYVLAQAPEHRDGLRSIDALRLEQDYYRACVPGEDPSRWLCLFVNTAQRPAGVTRDPDQAPNSAYRLGTP